MSKKPEPVEGPSRIIDVRLIPEVQPDDYWEVPLYGEAAAIRSLYQGPCFDEVAPKPPRRPRRSRLALLLHALRTTLNGAAPPCVSH